MISRMSHTTIFVLDQTIAYDFYVNALGLEVRTDIAMETGGRWIAAGPKEQPDLDLILMLITPDLCGADPNAREMVPLMLRLLNKGLLTASVFVTYNLEATYTELLSKGVEFVSPPTEKFYGKETIFKDPFGNCFSLGEKPQA